MRIGGVTGWLRSAAIAATAGVPFSSHLYPEFSAHLLRVTRTAHWLEWQDWADPILQRPVPGEGRHGADPGCAGRRASRGTRMR